MQNLLNSALPVPFEAPVPSPSDVLAQPVTEPPQVCGGARTSSSFLEPRTLLNGWLLPRQLSGVT